MHVTVASFWEPCFKEASFLGWTSYQTRKNAGNSLAVHDYNNKVAGDELATVPRLDIEACGQHHTC